MFFLFESDGFKIRHNSCVTPSVVCLTRIGDWWTVDGGGGGGGITEKITRRSPSLRFGQNVENLGSMFYEMV